MVRLPFVFVAMLLVLLTIHPAAGQESDQVPDGTLGKVTLNVINPQRDAAGLDEERDDDIAYGSTRAPPAAAPAAPDSPLAAPPPQPTGLVGITGQAVRIATPLQGALLLGGIFVLILLLIAILLFLGQRHRKLNNRSPHSHTHGKS